jgi:hypothetical protein
MGFRNLKTVVDPINEDFERYLVGSLIDKMNNFFPLSQALDFAYDRFLEEEVFRETMNPMDMVLVGASHLRNLARLIDISEWQVHDLTTLGWRMSRKKQLTLSILDNRLSWKRLQPYCNFTTTVCIWWVGQAAQEACQPVTLPDTTTLTVS